MSVPKFEKFFLPTLKFFGDGEVHTKKEACEFNKDFFNLSEDDILETTGEGHKLRYKDRTDWAVTYLYNAGLLKRESRGNYIISDSGHELLDTNPQEIDNDLLMGYESFANFKRSNQDEENEITSETFESLSPTDRLDEAYSEINENLSSILLDEILQNSPDFFEDLVVDLMIKMYGGSKKEAGKRIGKVGDGGVDGVIYMDSLGLNKFYIQAKRYSEGNKVRSVEINSFIGALERKNTDKGVFITTSDFTSGAKRAKDEANKRIVLINGEKLIKLLIEYDIGVYTTETYEIKNIDGDYFDN